METILIGNFERLIYIPLGIVTEGVELKEQSVLD